MKDFEFFIRNFKEELFDCIQQLIMDQSFIFYWLVEWKTRFVYLLHWVEFGDFVQYLGISHI